MTNRANQRERVVISKQQRIEKNQVQISWVQLLNIMSTLVKILTVTLGLCHVKVCVSRYSTEFEKHSPYTKLTDTDITSSTVSERYM